MPAAGVVMIIAVVLIVAALVFYLVSTIVAMGGRVYEVAPRHQTLEDRFLQLLEDREK